MKSILFVTLCFCFLFLTACSSTPSRYSMRVDSAPIHLIPNHKPSTVLPKYEPYRLINMQPYTINGINYQPMLTGKGYAEKGNASWYGQKFHGHLTSNGEIFDMYEFTAAHKTLPLPSYAKVTNNQNGKSLIVRINDRGPFHPDRLIDLSFAAAKKLDYLKSGTAPVKVEVIHVSEDNWVSLGKNAPIPLKEFMPVSPLLIVKDSTQNVQPLPTQQGASQSTNNGLENTFEQRTLFAETQKKQTFIQVIALSNKTKAKQKADGLTALYQQKSKITSTGMLYKILLGPFTLDSMAELALADLQKNGYPNAFLLQQ
jgi:rare lipoprotein A